MCSDVYTFVELSKWANVYMKMVVYIHVKYGEYEPCFQFMQVTIEMETTPEGIRKDR